MYICVCVCIYIYIYIYIYMSVCLSVCVYIYSFCFMHQAEEAGCGGRSEGRVPQRLLRRSDPTSRRQGIHFRRLGLRLQRPEDVCDERPSVHVSVHVCVQPDVRNSDDCGGGERLRPTPRTVPTPPTGLRPAEVARNRRNVAEVARRRRHVREERRVVAAGGEPLRVAGESAEPEGGAGHEGERFRFHGAIIGGGTVCCHGNHTKQSVKKTDG